MAQVSDGGWACIKVTIAFIVLDILATIGRLLARKVTKSELGADDFWIIVALVAFMANVAADYWSIFSGGVGRPLNTLSPQELIVYFKADYVSTFLNMINVLAVRLSVLCLYRRIFITQTFRRITLALGVIIVLHVLLIMIAGAIRCLPVASIWDRSVPSDFCINYSAGFLWGMIINACIDAAILCLPIVMIRRLQLRSAKKMALIGIFLLGAGTCIAAVLRVALVYNPNPDQFDRVKLIIWSNVETGVGLICACLPTYRPLFSRLSKSFSQNWSYLQGLRRSSASRRERSDNSGLKEIPSGSKDSGSPIVAERKGGTFLVEERTRSPV